MLRLGPGRKITKDGEEIKPENLLQVVFSESLESMEGWTLRDMMETIHPFGDFFGEMSLCNYAAFYAEMQKPAKKRDSDVKYIAIERVAQLEDDGYVNEYWHVNGTNDHTDEECRISFEKDPNNCISNSYAIEFTPVNELADLPIKIKSEYEITMHVDGPPFKKVIFKANKNMTFLDVIWAILWEISFMGNPASRDEHMDTLNKAMDDIKSGKSTTVPAEQVFDKFHDEEAERKLNDELA